jgi:hypothetical protein
VRRGGESLAISAHGGGDSEHNRLFNQATLRVPYTLACAACRCIMPRVSDGAKHLEQAGGEWRGGISGSRNDNSSVARTEQASSTRSPAAWLFWRQRRQPYENSWA